MQNHINGFGNIPLDKNEIGGVLQETTLLVNSGAMKDLDFLKTAVAEH